MDNDKELKECTLDLYKSVLAGKRRWSIGYWNEPDAKLKASICIKYLYDLKYKNKAIDYFYGLPQSFFVNNKLGNMLKVVFNGDKIEATSCAIPGFKEKHLKKVEAHEKFKREMEEKQRIEEETKDREKNFYVKWNELTLNFFIMTNIEDIY